MKARDNDKGSFEPIPEGQHLGVCVGIIDLGTQHNHKFNKYERKCLISFELPEVRIEIEEDGETRDVPRFISRRFTLSLGRNSHLRKFLRTWRGKDFTPEELKGFEMKTLLGVPAVVQVMQEEGKDGKVYSNIDSVRYPMKGTETPDAENEETYFSFEEVGSLREVDDALDNMPEWIQNLVQKSVEYSDLAKANQETMGMPSFSPVEGVPDMLEPDDNIPF